MSLMPILPPHARDALALIAINAVPSRGDDVKLVALLQPQNRPGRAEPDWRLFVAHRDIEFTYAGDLACEAVEPLRHAAILEEGEAAGRVILQLSEIGVDLCRAVADTAPPTTPPTTPVLS